MPLEPVASTADARFERSPTRGGETTGRVGLDASF
jgi:hypothetical protein